MKIFELLDEICRGSGLAYVIIGGHAVTAYGYSRETKDLDVVISRDTGHTWASELAKRGYTVFREASNFVQLSPPENSGWPIDLMLVNETTFNGILADSKKAEHLPSKPRIPSVEHLLALKLHALKYTHVGRFLRDFQDVIGLIQCQKLDPKSEKIMQLFEKYGTMDLYEKVLSALS